MKTSAVLTVAIFSAAPALAGVLPIADAYADSGLVARWDAIDNAGTGVHDPNASTWKDLVGGNDLTIVPDVGSAWTNGTAFYMNTIENAKCPAYGKSAASDYKTIEIVYKKAPSNGRILFCGGVATRYVVFDYTDTEAPFVNAQVYFDGAKDTRHTVVGDLEPTSLAAVYDDSGAVVDIYRDGAESDAGSKPANAWSVDGNSQQVRLGCRSINPDSANRQGWEGEVYTVRLYDRVLTAAEISRNYAIDRARFFGEVFATNVIVATAVEGLEGAEPSGVYAIDAEGHTFSAPKKATLDGSVYVCTGYTLETWDGSGWGAPVKFQSASYAATDVAAKVRLTWQWQFVQAEESADLDPLADGYAKSGLVMHFDGIRNAGADKPHDWTAAQWVDLAGGKRADFFHDGEDSSGWTADGYMFGGQSYAKVASQLAGLTNTVTVEIVCDTTVAALSARYSAENDSVGVKWPNLMGGGDSDGLNVYYNCQNREPTFKNANGGTVGLGAGNWESARYVTAMRDGTRNYIIQTASISGATPKTTDKGSIGAQTIYIGSAGSTLALRSRRWFTGVIKSIRVYDRVLSDAELAANRAIDEARFFGGALPVTNVVVASNVRGVSGDAPEGAYALPAAGRTFTAPATATVGEDTYSCTGYTLETWDGSAWGVPVLHSGETSCNLSDATAKVRLTWQWTHSAGPGFDAAFDDYVTDGLVLHLDGIRNAGPHPFHDGSAQTWADLAARGGAANFVSSGDRGGWDTDGYVFDGRDTANYAVMNGKRTLGAAYTAQIVLDFDTDASPRLGSYWPTLVGTTESGDKFGIYYNHKGVNKPNVRIKVANVSPGFELTDWNGEYMTAVSDGSRIALFPEASPAAYSNNFTQVPGSRFFTFAGGEGSSGGYAARRLAGKIRAARIYSRALTGAELAQNRRVDEARFFRRAPSADTGVLVVDSDVDGLSGNLPCGAYKPAGGYEFTAPAQATLGGTVYELAGYTVETWNGSAWTSPTTSGGASASPNVSSASKRLTWNWTVKSRLEKLGADVGDYVQDGLYLHLDGIRNAGADSAHDPNASTWANLGSVGAALDATFDYGTSSGEWAADGYSFVDGGKFAKLASNPVFGSNVTIQVVCNVAPSGSVNYPTLFGSTNDYLNIYWHRERAKIGFKVFNDAKIASGGEQLPVGALQYEDWDGDYVTAIWNAGKYRIFQTAVPEPATGGKWGGTWQWVADLFSGQPFYIGGVYKDGDASYVNQRRLGGKIQAVRVYNRTLTDDELEHNRAIDEVRFKNGASGANVIVATQHGGDGEILAEEPGSYKVSGEYTFSATAINNAKGVSRTTFGYFLEELSGGVWVNKTYHSGKSFTYSETSGDTAGKTVRITWAMNDGFVISLR